MATGNRHTTAVAIKQVLCQAKFDSAHDIKPNGSLAGGSFCDEASFDAVDKKLWLLVSGVDFKGDWPRL